jgi:hypothetical protein
MNLGPVLFCGDPLGVFAHIIDAAFKTDASAVILLADLEPRAPLHEELIAIRDRVRWIHGNHDADSDEAWLRVRGSELIDRNLSGRAVDLPDGTRIGGLGGSLPFIRGRTLRNLKSWGRWRVAESC